MIRWQTNDSGIIKFQLEYKDTNGTTDWITIYEDIENFWSLSTLSAQLVTFSVRAQNSFGYSDWSEQSAPIDIDLALANRQALQSSIYPILAGSLSAIIVMLLLLCLYIWSRKRLEKKSILGKFSVNFCLFVQF